MGIKDLFSWKIFIDIAYFIFPLLISIFSAKIYALKKEKLFYYFGVGFGFYALSEFIGLFLTTIGGVLIYNFFLKNPNLPYPVYLDRVLTTFLWILNFLFVILIFTGVYLFYRKEKSAEI